MADQHHAAAGAAQPCHLHVHLGDQRTGGVEDLEMPLLGFLAHRLRHAVGAEDHGGAIGHLVQFLDEHRAVVAQLVHHVAVVHHLVAHVDRRTVRLQRPFDDGDGAVDAGAETAGIGEQDVHESTSRTKPV